MEGLPIPMYDRVLVRKVEVENKSAGGILIPEKVVQQKQNTKKDGVILAIGCGYRNVDGSICPLQVKVGDEIYFNHFAGVPIPVGEEELFLMREEEILGIKKMATAPEKIEVNLSEQQKMDYICEAHQRYREVLSQNHPGEYALFIYGDEPEFYAAFPEKEMADKVGNDLGVTFHIFPIGV